MDGLGDYGLNNSVVRDLEDFLQKLGDGSKVFFIDTLLYRSLEHLNALRDVFEKRKNIVGCFRFRDSVDYLPAEKVVYILRADLSNVRAIAAHLLSYTRQYPEAVPLLCFAPQKTLLMEHILRSELKLDELIPRLSIESLDIDVIAFEKNVFSLEILNSFRLISVRNDLSPLSWVARALLKLEKARCFSFSSVVGRGEKSVKVIRMLKSLEADMENEVQFSGSSQQENVLMLFDRTVDLVTPMLTQLTYEGLIDEEYTIEGSSAAFPFNLGESVTAGDRVILCNFDKVFKELRDKNITTVGSVLYQKSIWIKENYEKRKSVQQLKELKEFLKSLPEMQEYHKLVSIHTNITSELGNLIQSIDFGERIRMEHNIIQQTNTKEVLEYIENLIYRKEDLSKVLRLLSLVSIVNGGLKTKDYEHFKDALMLAYGIPHIISVFFDLEQCGLLHTEGKTSSNYAAVRKHLQTWVSTLDEQNPNDIAYTYSGYAPPLVRLAEKFLNDPKFFSTDNDVVSLLPGGREETISLSRNPGAKRHIFFCVIGA